MRALRERTNRVGIYKPGVIDNFLKLCRCFIAFAQQQITLAAHVRRVEAAETSALT